MNTLQAPTPPVQRVIDELAKPFSVLNICDVTEWLENSLGINLLELSYEEESAHILKFCENFGLYLYSAHRENFYEWEGIELAKAGGWKGVLLEDLS